LLNENIRVDASSATGSESRKEWLNLAIAVTLVIAAYFLQDVAVSPVYHWLRLRLALPHAPSGNPLYCSTYILLASLRLIWWAAIAGLVYRIEPATIKGILPRNRRSFVLLFSGLGIGLLAMVGTILMIAAVGDARFSLTQGSLFNHVKYGAGWMLGELILASSEELLFRGLILALAARVFGIRVAFVVSAAAFMYVHGANPGASGIWLARLGAAGLLLAYSVFRSGSLWWAIGYHAGWNWGSAPLFGAAGSGYRNEGHILSFFPQGSSLITGGAVGPEGSIFAFLAVIIATALLIFTVRQSPNRWHSIKRLKRISTTSREPSAAASKPPKKD